MVAVHNDGVVYHYNGKNWKKIKTSNRYPLLGHGDVFQLEAANQYFTIPVCQYLL